MSFLKAEWRNLAIANYLVQAEFLKKYVPYGTELDFWQNKCFVSLVGFLFTDTKLLGIKIPYHVNFEEVNLRFYVKKYENGNWKRGVVFIKEIVPKATVSFVANTFYKENYETRKMSHSWTEDQEKRTVFYAWVKDKRWNSISIQASLETSEIAAGSETEFITEHYWGYAKHSETKTVEYEVTHPKWKKYDILKSEIKVDFGLEYGSEFSFLNLQKPASVMLAEGSVIKVENKKTFSRKINSGN